MCVEYPKYYYIIYVEGLRGLNMMIFKHLNEVLQRLRALLSKIKL